MQSPREGVQQRMSASQYQPRITLLVRSLCPKGAAEQQDRIIERLQAMAAADRIDGFSVTIWGDRVPCDGQTAASRDILERIESFESWSERAGTSLSPFFRVGESGSMLTEETRTTVEVPVLCLAEYHHDELRHVAPCVDDGSVCTISDRLDVLEEGAPNVKRGTLASR